MKSFSFSPIKANSFLLDVDIVSNKILVHPQSKIYSIKIKNFEIFVKCNRYPIKIKNKLFNYIKTEFTKDYRADISNCLNKLDGDFSIIVVDLKNNKVMMARDRCGLQCIYYLFFAGKISISDSLKNIINHALTGVQISKQAVDLYFGLGFIPAPYSVYKNVSKVPAGFFVSLENSRIKTHSFVEITNSEENKTEEMLVDEFYNLIKEAVYNGLDNHNQQTILFSGGIDSSLVASLMAKKSKTKINTVYIGNEGDIEAEHAAAAAAFINSSHSLIPMKYPSWQELVKLIVELNEPMADSMLLPLTYAMNKVTQVNSYCWSAVGADDLFCGLYEHVALNLWQEGLSVPDIKSQQGDKKSSYIIRNMLKEINSETDPVLGWVKLISRVTNEDRNKLSGIQHREETQSPTCEFLQTWINSAPDFLSGAKRFAAKVRLPDLTMRIIESSSNSSGLEHFSPFLTNKIVEFSEGSVTPTDRPDQTNSSPLENLREKIRVSPGSKEDEMVHSIFIDKEGKGLIRRLYRRLCPVGLQGLPKRGFSLPLTNLLHFYRGEIDKLLKENNDNFLDSSVVHEWWKKFLMSKDIEKHRKAGRVWMALLWILWHKIEK